MRVTYHGYYLSHRNGRERCLFDMREFLGRFAEVHDANYKNQFVDGGEQMYLFPLSRDCFMFVRTSSNEVMRRVNTATIQAEEIYALLGPAERLGMVSFVLFDDHYLAFGYTPKGPRISALCRLLDAIFASTGLGHYAFCTKALMHQAAKDEVVHMPEVGRAEIVVARENTLFQDIVGLFGFTAEEVIDIKNLEITIRPRRNKSIAGPVAKVLQSALPEGQENAEARKALEKAVVRARADLDDQLVDYYLTAQGAIGDHVNIRGEAAINEQIMRRMEGNAVLLREVEEFENDENDAFTQMDCGDIRRFSDVDPWTAMLRALQDNHTE
ncbi:MAG: hypothetical protein AB1646_16805 [Thermodesulfobacteriota bacterium]